MKYLKRQIIILTLIIPFASCHKEEKKSEPGEVMSLTSEGASTGCGGELSERSLDDVDLSEDFTSDSGCSLGSDDFEF